MLLEARDISFAYGAQQVLSGVSLSLSPGQIIALIGPNGSGKSTLMRILAGLLPAQGTLLWDGKPHWRPRTLAQKVAYLPQFPTFDEGQTVADVLRAGRIPYLGPFGIESPQDLLAIEQVAQQLGLVDWLSRPMDQLSGGQRQRVFLGRCLAQQPAAMLLDEPNSALDVKHQVELFQLLRQLAREQRLGILIASHELNLAAAHADQMLLLDQGRTAALGPPPQVMRQDLLSRVYGVNMVRLEDNGVVAVVAGGALCALPDPPDQGRVRSGLNEDK